MRGKKGDEVWKESVGGRRRENMGGEVRSGVMRETEGRWEDEGR